MKLNSQAMDVFDIRISLNQDKFACSLIESPLKIFDLTSGELIAQHVDSNYDSSWSLDWFQINKEEFLVSGYGNNGYVRIIDSQGKDRLKYARKSDDIGYPDAAQLHSNSVWKIRTINGECFSVADDGVMARLKLDYDASKNSFKYTRKHETRLPIYGKLYDFCQFHENHFLIAHKNGIYETAKKRFSSSCAGYYKGHSNRVISVCKLNDKQFVSSSWDKTIILWNIDQYSPLESFKTSNAAYNLLVKNGQVFHADGGSIVIRGIKDLKVVDNIKITEKKLKCFDITDDLKTIVAGDERGNIFIHKL